MKNISTKQYLFLLILFIIPGSLLLRGEFTPDTQQNHSSLDFSDTSLNNFNNLKPKASFDPVPMAFEFSEAVEKEFSYSVSQNSSISFESPIQYNFTELDVSLNIFNATQNEITIQDETDGIPVESNFLEGQEFNLLSSSIVSTISVYLSGKNRVWETSYEIRQAEINGTSIYQNIANISTVSTQGWANISLPEVQLDAGKYFFVMGLNEDSNPNAQYWMRSPTGFNDTQTWAWVGSDWEAVNYDLLLKIYSYETINPESIEMEINANPVFNLGDGQGFSLIKIPITDSITTLAVTANDTSFAYSAELSAIYFRDISVVANVSCSGEDVLWNLNPNLFYPQDSFHSYRVNFTKIRGDYTNILITNNGSGLSYSRVNDTMITFSEPADEISFKSPNYLSALTFPSQITPEELYLFNVTTLGTGNLTIEIYDKFDTLVLHNSSENTQDVEFWWQTAPTLFAGTYQLYIYFCGDQEAGSYHGTMELLTAFAIDSNDIEAAALGVSDLSLTLHDKFSLSAIEGAQVTFQVSTITGQLVETDSQPGTYTTSIDLDENALLPGVHQVNYTIQKSGYQTIYLGKILTILPRSIGISVDRDIKSVRPGQTVQFTLTLTDPDQDYLKRPVDAHFTIRPTGNPGATPIYTNDLEGLSGQEEFGWKIDSTIDNLEATPYDIVISIDHPLYAEVYVLEGGITILPLIPLYQIIGAILAGIAIAVSVFIRLNIRAAKNSLYGLLLLNEHGICISSLLSDGLDRYDDSLIAGALSGILSLMTEITGGGLRAIHVEQGYLLLVKGKDAMLAVFMKKNPGWISKSIRKLLEIIEKEYGVQIRKWKGQPIQLDLNSFLKRQFKMTIRIPVITPKSEDLYSTLIDREQ